MIPAAPAARKVVASAQARRTMRTYCENVDLAICGGQHMMLTWYQKHQTTSQDANHSATSGILLNTTSGILLNTTNPTQYETLSQSVRHLDEAGARAFAKDLCVCLRRML